MCHNMVLMLKSCAPAAKVLSVVAGAVLTLNVMPPTTDPLLNGFRLLVYLTRTQDHSYQSSPCALMRFLKQYALLCTAFIIKDANAL
jgi:hypothetical protein